MEGKAVVQFVNSTKDSVIAFLKEARKRVVIAKAGYFVDLKFRS